MKRHALIGTLLLLATAGTPPTLAAPSIPPAVQAAVANAARPAEDTARDAERKPAETLATLRLVPGKVIYELFPGKGYYTRILGALAGPHGRLLAAVPNRRPDADPAAPDPAAEMQALAAGGQFGHVEVTRLVDRLVKVDSPVDVVWTSLNYHDLHNVPGLDIGAFNRSVFDALRPGGLYVVIDHAAAPGSGARDTNTLHRIDPALVRQEVVAAGFRLVKESPLLREPGDDHTLKVFDPAIRGKTDQFILEFRKPD